MSTSHRCVANCTGHPSPDPVSEPEFWTHIAATLSQLHSLSSGRDKFMTVKGALLAHTSAHQWGERGMRRAHLEELGGAGESGEQGGKVLRATSAQRIQPRQDHLHVVL